MDAGHFHSSGSYPGLRFDPDNIHGQCRSCNRFQNNKMEIGAMYRANLIKKIGLRQFELLEAKAGHYKRHGKKVDRRELIEFIKSNYKNARAD